MALESEPTVVPGIVLSDMSIVEQGTQKRSMIGCFDQFAFPQFPARYDRFFVTASISNVAGTLSDIELTIRIEEKGSAHVVFSTTARIDFHGEKTFERGGIMGFSVPVLQVVFQKAGTYRILLLINGVEAGERDFNVLQQVVKKERNE